MRAAEINMVATSSKEALALYKQIFEVTGIKETDIALGQNEVFFEIHGMQFHILDENKDFGLVAPKQDQETSCWFNITLENIHEVFEKATNLGCEIIMPITFVETHNVHNFMFKDCFGYVWLVHQVA